MTRSEGMLYYLSLLRRRNLMESSGLLRKAWEKYVMEEYMRPSPFPSESCSNYKPRETEVITDISNDIKLHKVKGVI
jgi:hypothetical protein